MSTATIQARVQEPQVLRTAVEPQLVVEIPTRSRFVDEQPFAVLGIFIVISMALASGFVAALAIWLYQLRYSGVFDIKL
ncbi:MAG TPA: hypothetical protein VJV96_11040 [Candidatus Angelobacter sp.]|jgi:preprotein translocase subunit SecB|nr:hypothetical protein [Candidatus Angelobacter sp.]